MTLNEFRAWFDGFSEAIGDAPTPEQWAKIKAKVSSLDPLTGLAGMIPLSTLSPAAILNPDLHRAKTSAGDPNACRPITVARN